MVTEVFTKPSFDMAGKVAIVTGATKGIGFAIASVFAASGCNVVVTSRTPADCERVEKEIGEKYGVTCLGIPADSSNGDDIDKVISKSVEQFGKLDILINNAGIAGPFNFLINLTGEEYMKVLDVNLKGHFMFGKAVAQQFIKQGSGGKIINMASVGGLLGEKCVAFYSSSKAAVINLTKTMANEWARYNITVNAVCPGLVLTDMNKDLIFSDPETIKVMEKRIPMRRMAQPEEIAVPILCLVSDAFSYMTGTHVIIDGGHTIGD